MAQGNPNPSPKTRFKKGKSGNPGGMSSEARRKIDEARDKAATVYLEMITALEKEISKKRAGKLDHIDPATLKLLKDIYDRSEGTPKQSVDHSSEDGSMSPITKIERVIVKPNG